MLTYEEIMNYCSDYKIVNGIVIDKKLNQQIIDDDIILKVKSSILLFMESKKSYQNDIQQFGRTTKSKEDYIKKTMEKFGVNNEKNSYGINKLVNAILSSNGHYEENMSGNDLQNSKFSILVAPKSEYGLAYLKLKFREKNLDIEDLKISQDLTELQHNGVSKVIIDFKIKKYIKTTQNTEQIDLMNQFQHPRARELNELEMQKQIAKQNNDEVAYNYAKSAIKKIIIDSQTEVNPKQWDSMNLSQQISFIKIKIHEAKILQNEDDFNYWNSNLRKLKSKLVEQSKQKQIVNTTNNSSKLDLSVLINELRSELNKIQNTYHSMLFDGYIDDEELAIVINMVNKVINDGYSLKSLATDQSDIKIISTIINTLEEEQTKMNKMQNKNKEINRNIK